MEEAKYDVEQGMFYTKLPKMNEGEHFPDLDMIYRLFNKKDSN
jgi:hypothetical protein